MAALTWAADTSAQQSVTATNAAEAFIPQYVLTLPVVFQDQILGDAVVEIGQNGSARFDRDSLLEQLLPLISPDSQDGFAQSFLDEPMVSPVQLQREGIQLRYDPETLQVLVESIDPSIGAVRTLGPVARYVEIPATQTPESLSAYVNTVAELRYDQSSDQISPLADVFAAVRVGGVVLELDAGYDEFLTESGFYRRAARAVYDQPEHQRRISAGDIRQDNVGLLGSVFLGGVSLEKGQRVFDRFRPLYNSGAQQISVDRRIVADVVSNGNVIDTIELTPGNYDLSQLPLRYGATDIDLVATDGSGRRLFSSLDLFVDPYDLGRGEVEYMAAIGYTADTVAFNPEYSEDLAFSGSYRRGVTNRLVLGGGLQLSEDQQVLALESRLNPQNIPGRLEFSAAGSSGETSGVALSSGYFATFRDSDHYSQLSLSGYFESGGFGTIGESGVLAGLQTLSLNASYNRSLDDRTSLLAGTNWIQREGLADERA
ncbi:MAG: hypothetical protein WA989_04395, partial [Henriciella sp.]|uniref:hypothetical protein n=1 Tax=Henriciella sp. TaxID=1968823 RepID=UPI003C74220F